MKSKYKKFYAVLIFKGKWKKMKLGINDQRESSYVEDCMEKNGWKLIGKYNPKSKKTYWFK